jgi:hypothetical protein
LLKLVLISEDVVVREGDETWGLVGGDLGFENISDALLSGDIMKSYKNNTS